MDGLYGLLAEFTEPQTLLKTARAAAESGLRRVDAFTPYPVEGLREALGFRRTRLPLLILVSGLLGAIGGYYLQYWISVIDYPLNIGGRPFHSWPAFVPVTFECTILFAGVLGTVFFFLLNRLPQLHHPVFSVPPFERASQDRFFLCVERADAAFDHRKIEALLRKAGAVAVTEVRDDE